ncbi:MAG: hypothetical protein JST52_07565 [Bacteroidetes bacterium]|nr:hypothetical protein [Bacteroidota bacterium]MBS1740271.1 hypothetical protein [Bacteroidota bacterium]MBS1776483.1 hypothetical protein [Bacteroidota bacterium]
MQIILLAVVAILSIVLYRMLSGHRATYPFVRTTRVSRTEADSQYYTTEAEHGLITIDDDIVIVDGQEYSLRPKNESKAEASLQVDNGKLVSIHIQMDEGEKIFFIDPEHSLFSNYRRSYSNSEVRHIFSF